jgi:hypothetical protein
VSALEANRAEIERFVNTLFLHADRDNFVSLRAFPDDADGVWRRERWRTVRRPCHKNRDRARAMGRLP